jgi:DNA-binding IclR family transcriptional regulator
MEVIGRGVQSVEVGGRILSAMILAGQPLMLRDIAAGAKITAPQAHAYIVSFRKLGLVEQDVSSGRYQLGPFALQLGLARLRSSNPLRMTSDAVVSLATEVGLMVTVTVWGTFGPTIVQVQEAVEQLHVNLRAGAVYSLTGTATGRVFATFLPAAVIKPRIAAELRDGPRSQRVGSPMSSEQVAQQLAEIKRLGYATAIGSPIPGVNAISAPVFDHTGQMQLAVTLIGPAGLVDVGQDSPQAQRLLAFTEQLSAQLGYNGGLPLDQQNAGDVGKTVVHLVPKREDKETSARRRRERRA